MSDQAIKLAVFINAADAVKNREFPKLTYILEVSIASILQGMLLDNVIIGLIRKGMPSLKLEPALIKMLVQLFTLPALIGAGHYLISKKEFNYGAHFSEVLMGVGAKELYENLAEQQKKYI
jgi:hypothetical protein